MTLPKFTLALALSAALLAGPIAHAQTLSGTGTTTVSTSRTVGVVNSMGPDALIIRSETSTAPITYSSTGTTSFVDESGSPVAREVVSSGFPVTVEYSRDGERLIANRVIVHRQTTTTGTTSTNVVTPGTPAVIERTVTSPPVVVEKKVYVDRPVIVEKKVPVDRPVIVEKKVPVDRPVIVEKQVPAPVIEETKTTRTTTTTTTPKKNDD